ncbi:hypothetical protein [Natrinema longum]|uniref:Uncharacterized protein n=1 Tax=Natrinema longum TaxID=370324 RepID=A0A8A2UAJ0_9EURY|nr:hypothetical protein [Natrinema longum]MBZ6496460.1 hypothetical protein [Natrinema longum]QSW85634.1 hypothetical protein J0X27_01965 [Natrinema longum]
MSNDETRGKEGPDRRDESAHSSSYRSLLESIDTDTTTLLEAITDDETLEPDVRLAAKRHCRELRAELECLHRHLPEAGSAYADDGRANAITTVSGPFEAAREAFRRREGESPKRDGDRTSETGGESGD